MTAFFRQLGGAVGIAVLSSIALLLLHGHVPAGAEAAGAGLGGMLDAALAAHGAVHASDLPFRQVMWVGALVSLLSFVFVARLPRRAHARRAAARLAASIE